MIIAVSLALVTAPLLASEALMASLTAGYSHTDLDRGAAIAGFIALGGGEERIAEAVRLAHDYPEAELVITGAGDAETLKARSIPADRVLIEPRATTTYENAVFTARLLGARAQRRWVLVTSASHMPRAMATFRKAGLAVDPWPVPDPSEGWRGRLLRAGHEEAGLLVYWLQGKADFAGAFAERAPGQAKESGSGSVALRARATGSEPTGAAKKAQRGRTPNDVRATSLRLRTSQPLRTGFAAVPDRAGARFLPLFSSLRCKEPNMTQSLWHRLLASLLQEHVCAPPDADTPWKIVSQYRARADTDYICPECDQRLVRVRPRRRASSSRRRAAASDLAPVSILALVASR